MRKFTLALCAVTMAVPVVPVIPTTAASAQSGYYHGKTWRDSRGRLRCRRSNGTVGIIVGGAAGALVGRAVDGGRHRTAGTVIGAAAGALAGREIARNRSTRRCR
jgi:outer membrane lipoprotein SlyB